MIAIFRSFIEKILIPQIRKNDGHLQDWNRFNSLINTDTLNIPELQNYVETLPHHAPLQERKEHSLTARKKEDAKHYEEPSEPFSASKTVGGERAKLLVGVKSVHPEGSSTKFEVKAEPFQEAAHHRDGKDYSQGKEYSSGREDSFRRGGNVSNPHSIGGSPQSGYQPVSVLSSLDRLLKQLTENQQKI